MATDAMAPPEDTSCHIKKLSVELLLRVTFWLETPDYCSVRLTCRAFENMLLNSFVHEFIEQKQFMVSPSSLEALVELSKSRLGVHLRRLQIGTDVLELDSSWGEARGNAEARRLVQAQKVCIRDGTHRKLLAEAFRNLSHTNGGLRGDFEVVVRSFNSRRRTRDAASLGRSAEWNSYGTATARQLGVWVTKRTYHFDSRITMTDVFRWVLVALSDAGVQPSGIEVMTRNDDILVNDAFAIGTEPNVPFVLEGLKKLHLCTGKGGAEERFDPDSLTLDTTVDIILNDLPEFLTYCTNLKELRINQEGFFTKWSETFLIWLSKAASAVPEPTPRGWPDPMQFSNLETLSLGKVVTRPWILQKVITKLSPTLRSIELWRVTLATRYGFSSVNDCPEAVAWKNFLNSLTSIQGLDLEHILVGNASECFYSGNQLRLDGAVERRMQFDGDYKYEYRGATWTHAIRDMVKALHAQQDLATYKRMLRVSVTPDSDVDEDEEMQSGKNRLAVRLEQNRSFSNRSPPPQI